MVEERVAEDGNNVVSQHGGLGNATASPAIQQLPSEIISEIFALHIPDSIDDTDKPWGTFDIESAPWIFTHICSSWRAVAISQPELWSYIRIDLEKLALAGRLEPPLPMLETYLQRSGDFPLRISFQDSYRPTEYAEKVLTCLMSHSQQWTHVLLFISFSNLHLTNQIKGRLPLLQYLNIGAYGANTFLPCEGFEIAPKLRKVYIIGDLHTVQLPLSQLTTLGGETTDFPDIVGECSQLSSCSFKFPRRPFIGMSAPIIRHELLQKLEMDLVGVLRRFEFPSIRELHITSRTRGGMDLVTMTGFLRRSNGLLKVLSWIDASITDPPVFVSLLESVPNLVHLTIKPAPGEMTTSWDVISNLIEPLAFANSLHMVPYLESITLDIEQQAGSPSRSIMNAFLDMVESRWQGGSQHLREAKLSTLRITESDITPIRERVQRLLSQGLKVIYEDISP